MGHAFAVWASRMVSWFQQGEAGLAPVGSPHSLRHTVLSRSGQTGTTPSLARDRGHFHARGGLQLAGWPDQQPLEQGHTCWLLATEPTLPLRPLMAHRRPPLLATTPTLPSTAARLPGRVAALGPSFRQAYASVLP